MTLVYIANRDRMWLPTLGKRYDGDVDKLYKFESFNFDSLCARIQPNNEAFSYNRSLKPLRLLEVSIRLFSRIILQIEFMPF